MVDPEIIGHRADRASWFRQVQRHGVRLELRRVHLHHHGGLLFLWISAIQCPGCPHFGRKAQDPDGPTLLFPAEAWASFLAGVKGGEFPSL
ncbi:DUF397 domain-containing protein [Kitasatospora cathayae]|uniref:DUF397 domain-containing protein n=1 Tax=Kitasatospora cathayae TaxID=3004092 RepID=UPI0038600F0F